MRVNRSSTPVVAAALALLLAGPAMAQGPMMGGDRGWGFGLWWDGPGFWGRGPDGMQDRIEGRLAFLKAELKITEAQTAAWNGLAEAIRTAAKQHNARMKAAWDSEEKAKTLPERLNAQEERLSARLEEIKQIKSSLAALYAVLSEEQRREADDIVLPMTGMGPMHGHGGPRRWWGP